jgi:hypothetical protein
MTPPGFQPVDPLSLSSLLLQPLANGRELATATGFVVRYADRLWLITNHHVVTGRDTETRKVLSQHAALPDAIQIWHHSKLSSVGYGAWTPCIEALLDNVGRPRWLQHPKFFVKDMERPFEPNIDLVALPLEGLHNELAIYPLDLELATTDVRVAPGLPVSIIGYPFGKTGPGLFPIWKTGHIATDPQAYWSPRYFLVDATTRDGMSGSPVVFRPFGIYQDTGGLIVADETVKLLGVYSGRLQRDAELGRVWHPHLIKEIISDGVPGTSAH